MKVREHRGRAAAPQRAAAGLKVREHRGRDAPDRQRLDVARRDEGRVEARVDRRAAHRLVVLPDDGELVRDDRLVLRERNVLIRERGRLRPARRLGRGRQVRAHGREPLDLIRVDPPVSANLGVRGVGVRIDRVNIEERRVCVAAASGPEH